MSSSGSAFHEQALEILGKTDIVASAPHSLEALVNPTPGTGLEDSLEPQPVVGLLQKILQGEAEEGWRLACMPRPWKTSLAQNGDSTNGTTDPALMKHDLPAITVPSALLSDIKPRLPELFSSIYSHQEFETVPPTSDLASILVRDSLVDTINGLHYNRNVTAKFLIELDCYFAQDTFVKRGTPFDKLRAVEEGKSTWKPEDVAVDAVFSQLMRLPLAPQKEVYYHSVLTEACKMAPAAVAPSLGRAIRWFYSNIDTLDLELVFRFMDWFSHHLSNFAFTWKWTEW